jgi:hypothetical protein
LLTSSTLLFSARQPFYDTTQQHFHGYNERHFNDKATHWEREYKFHTPTADRIKQRFIVRAGRSEHPRTQAQDAQVQEVIQARTGLLGSTCDLSTMNSTRVAKRYGESQRLGEAEWPIPQRLAAASAAGGGLSAQEAWSLRTIPATRTSSTRMGGAASTMNHPSFKKSGPRAGAVQPYNSRQGEYESEYTAGYGDLKGQSNWITNRSNFLPRSLEAHANADSVDLQAHVAKTQRPLSPTQPLVERVNNERISQTGLVSMHRPVWRREYPDLLENTISQRPQPYSFDLRDHIEAMRKAPLFKDQLTSGERVSESRSGVRSLSWQQEAEGSLHLTTSGGHQQRGDQQYGTR